MARHLRTDCALWSASEALAALGAATTRDEKLTLVYAAAPAATEQQGDQVAAAFQDVARDPDAGVRQSVIIATGYLPHPGLVDLVRRLRDGDPVEHVRKNAEILLTALS
ncbi:hypothetical protein GCM10022224_090000 [Nonomuraea antimicrobica]|uniref:HEAT repeat-containing protein n=1 Tax=Nonomuraea antimicrobica TaxID=561173 RepID=A0ABP7E0C8_9ACTN